MWNCRTGNISMDIEKLREYCLSMEGVTEKMPFGKFARRYDSLLVFYVMDHMFCLFDMNDFSYVDVRSTPVRIDEMRVERVSVSQPVNRSMKYWIEIEFGGDVSDDEIYVLVREAYEIVKKKYTKVTK